MKERMDLSHSGGSLDVYKRIPEHVLGRIAVAVSTNICKTDKKTPTHLIFDYFFNHIINLQ